jgi:sugar lactone lactonase YvrE
VTLALLAVLAVLAQPAATPSARLAAAPPRLVVGQAWSATVIVRGTGRPVVRGRLGARTVSFGASPVGRGRYRVVVRFATAGTWTLSAVLGRQEVVLGRVQVADSYLLAQPAGVLVLPDGSVLVCERGSKNRVLRVDPASGRFSVFATGTPVPFGLARAADGSIVVAGDAGIFRVPPTGGRASQLSAVPASPIAFAPNGDLYYGHFTELGRIRPGSRAADRLSTEVNFPHGLAVAEDGSLLVSDTGNKRLIRVDPRDGRVTVVAAGLRTPMGVVLERSGAALVLEFDLHSVSRIAPNGSKTTVATGLPSPYALARAQEGAVYVVETGSVSRATGTLDQIDDDGSHHRIRLLPQR